MKKILLVFLIAVLVSGAAFAKSHWFSAEGSILGGGGRYEMQPFDWFSIGVNVFFNTLSFTTADTPLWRDFAADFNIRLYPGGGTYYLGIGVGYHTHTGILSQWNKLSGFGMTPEMGWKMEFEGSGIFLQLGIKVPITMGKEKVWEPDESYNNYGSGSGSSNENGKYVEKYVFGFGFVPYLGIGFAF